MKLLRKFLNYTEEKIMLRFGRRIWQLIGFLSILAFVASLFLVVKNLLPTYRNEVHISKKEYIENEVDADFDETNNIDACTKQSYQRALDSLKGQMPESEWVLLTQTERVQRYREEGRYDPWYGYYTTYVSYYTNEETKNNDAIPNILESIYDSKGIDSTEYCEQIKVVRTLAALMKQTQKKVATKILKEYYRGMITYSDLQKDDVDRSVAIYQKVNGKKPFIIDPDNDKDPWQHLSSYLYTYSGDSLSEQRDKIAIDAATKLKLKGIKKPEYRNQIALWVLGSEMDDEANETCFNDLFTSKTVRFNEKNFQEKVYKYLNLYVEKYRLAEEIKAQEEFEKEERVELYGSSGLVSFGTILAIASILILYSIRQILKDKKD